eukprot:6190776-Pleurochrysis_carterae.AAC.1
MTLHRHEHFCARAWCGSRDDDLRVRCIVCADVRIHLRARELGGERARESSWRVQARAADGHGNGDGVGARTQSTAGGRTQ